jgi:NAD(P)H dehydrogenase (quinone)
MNISILYFSETGNTERMAGYIAEGIRSVGNAETRLINLAGKNEEDVAFLKESKAVIFGTPTYAASMCWQMKQFFDTDWNCDLAGKLGAVFATANCLHGGADVALLSVIGHLLVK